MLLEEVAFHIDSRDINTLLNDRNKESVKILENMEIHIDGVFPEQLFNISWPFETEDVKCYRKDIYQATTKGAFRRALNSGQRISNPDNYSVKPSLDFEKVIENKKFYGYSFLDFVFSFVYNQMMRDPNGILLTIPIPSNTSKTDFEIKYISSRHILYFHDYDALMPEYKKHFVFKSAKKENVGTSTSIYDYYFFVVDNETIWKLEKGPKNEWLPPVLMAEFALDNTPAIVLGGFWQESKKCYDSFLGAAVPFANEYVRLNSNYQGLLSTCGHPVREFADIDCQTCQGRGRIDGETCHSCNGTKKAQIQITPYSKFQGFTKAKNISALDDKVNLERPPIVWHTPNSDATATLSQYSQQVNWNKEEMEINLDIFHSKQAQSAIAKVEDKESERNKISIISDNVFRIIEQQIWIIEQMRNGQAAIKPVIIKPTMFDLRSTQDVLTILKEMNDSLVPAELKRDAYRDLLRKENNGNKLLNLQTDFLSDTDVLFERNDIEKATLMQLNVIAKAVFEYSVFASRALSELVKETQEPYLLFQNQKKLFESVKKRVKEMNKGNENLPPML